MKLSSWLFWDIDTRTLNYEKHSRFIIKRVLQRGDLPDWKEITGYYGKEVVINTSKTLKDLDSKTANFLSVIYKIPREEFQCYKNRQSTPKHWEY